MHNKRLYKKLMTLLDWFILILPFIILFVYSLILETDNFTFSNLLDNFRNIFSGLENSFIYNNISALANSILNTSTLPLSISCVCLYSTYIIIVVLLDMVRDLLLLIPTWFNNFLE